MAGGSTLRMPTVCRAVKWPVIKSAGQKIKGYKNLSYKLLSCKQNEGPLIWRTNGIRAAPTPAKMHVAKEINDKKNTLHSDEITVYTCV